MDGAGFTSTYFGEARGRTRVPCIFGEQSIQEFQVSNNPYSAAYGGGSGFVNTVTKSGTDHFHGDTFYYNPDGATLNQTCYLISSTGTEGFPDAAVHQPAQRAASVPVCVYLELQRGLEALTSTANPQVGLGRSTIRRCSPFPSAIEGTLRPFKSRAIFEKGRDNRAGC